MKYFSRAALFLHLSQIICFVAGFEGNQTFFDNSAAQKKCIDQCPTSDGYTKQTKKWCRTKLKGKPMTDNLEQAKKLCSQYSDCVGVYDFKCDNTGTLGYCKVDQKFSFSSMSCVYTKNSMKGSSDIQSNGDVGTSAEEVDPDLPVVQTVEPTNSDTNHVTNDDYFVTDLCQIANLCDSINSKFILPTGNSSKVVEYSNVDGEKIKVIMDYGKELLITLDENEDIIGGEFYDPKILMTDVFTRTNDGRFHVTKINPAEEKDHTDEEEKLIEQFEQQYADSSRRVALHEKLRRRRLQTKGNTWYTVKVTFSTSVANDIKAKGKSIHDVANQLIAETNQGYVNSKLNLEAHLLRAEVYNYNMKKYSQARYGWFDAFMATESIGALDPMYDGSCEFKMSVVKLSPVQMKREDCEKKCLSYRWNLNSMVNPASSTSLCIGVEMNGFLKTGSTGSCIIYRRKSTNGMRNNGEIRFKKPSKNMDGDTKCFKHNMNVGREADINVAIIGPADGFHGAGVNILDWAFVAYGSMLGGFTFGHEIGHAIGLMHSEGGQGQSCANKYNCGYVVKCFNGWSDRGMRTIMSYPSSASNGKSGCKTPGSERRINYYSNPNQKVQYSNDKQFYVLGSKNANNRQKILDEIENFREELTTEDACVSNPCANGEKCQAASGHLYKCGNGPWKGGEAMEDSEIRWVSVGWSKCSVECGYGIQRSSGFICMEGTGLASTESKCGKSKPNPTRTCNQYISCDKLKVISLGKTTPSPTPAPTAPPNCIKQCKDKFPTSGKPTTPTLKPTPRPTMKKPTPRPTMKKPTPRPTMRKPTPRPTMKKPTPRLTPRPTTTPEPTKPNSGNSFTKLYGKFCEGAFGFFHCLADAESACAVHPQCGAVTETVCQETQGFQLCPTPLKYSDKGIGPCLYERRPSGVNINALTPMPKSPPKPTSIPKDKPKSTPNPTPKPTPEPKSSIESYTKQTKKWCRTKLTGKPVTDNLEQAKKLCSQYSDCVGVYDFKCDNTGTLGYCKVGHSFSGSSSSCVYTKNSMKGSSDIQSNGDDGTSDEEVDPDLPVVETVEPTNSDEAESNVAFTFNEDNSTDRSRYHIIFVTGVVCAILVHILRSKQCSGFTSGYHKTTYETLL